MPLADWERNWLNWARPIVSCVHERPDHFDRCRDLLGDCGYDGSDADDSTLRWPGYVGERWKTGVGVLFVGSIHADFTAGNLPPDQDERIRLVEEMAVANRRWRDAPDDEQFAEEFLVASRAAYSALAPGWRRDEQFRLVRDALGEGIEEVSWTNLAHCRARPGCLTSEYPLQLACSSTAAAASGGFPIQDLIAAIRPAVVLACVRPLETTYKHRYQWSSGGWQAKLITFSGRDWGRSRAEWQLWAERVAVEITSLREGTSG